MQEDVDVLEPYATDLESIMSTFSWDTVFENVRDFLLTDDDFGFLSTALSTASSFVSSIFNVLISFVFAAYIVFSKETINIQSKRMLYSIFKESSANKILHVFSLTHNYFYKTVTSQVIDALVLGVLIFVTMTILKLPNALTIATLTGFLNLIPIMGAITGGIIGFILMLIESPTHALIFLVMIIVLQQLDGNVIYPKIVGDAVGLPQLWSLLGVVVGGALFGIIGMWIAVPLFAVIYTLLGEFTEHRLKQKNITIKKGDL